MSLWFPSSHGFVICNLTPHSFWAHPFPAVPPASLRVSPPNSLLSPLSVSQGPKSVALTEVGPRFELKLYRIQLGTMDQPHAELEWVARSFTRSAKKAKLAAAEEPEAE